MKPKFNSILAVLTLLLCINHAKGQQMTTADIPAKSKYFVDYVMGPYLFIDDIPYEAAFMNGCRLGFNIKNRFNFSIEYVAGSNPDILDNIGLTHNANLQFAYYFKPTSAPFNPYAFVGSGFLEFKDFTNDVYGLSYHVGLGTELKFTNRISGIIEARYLNTSLLDIDGQNQLGVFWGARLAF